MAIKNNEKDILLYKGGGLGCNLYKGSTVISTFSNKTVTADGNTRVNNTDNTSLASLTLYGKSVFSNGAVTSLTSPRMRLFSKNLFNKEHFTNASNWEQGGVYWYYPLDLTPGYYTLTNGYVTQKDNIYITVKGLKDYYVTGNGKFATKTTFRVTADKQVKIAWNQSTKSQATLSDLLVTFLCNVQIEEGSALSDYFPYKGETEIAYPNTVLRSLPLSDGSEICDTIDVLNGELIRRIDASIDNATSDITNQTQYLLSTPTVSAVTPKSASGYPLVTTLLCDSKVALSVRTGE